MPDIATSGAGVFTPSQQGVDSPQLNAIIGNAVIQPSFITGKPVANAPSVTDNILLARANGTYAQITYAALIAGIPGVAFPKGNSVINGDMSRWGRGTTFTQIADQTTTAERYKCRAATIGTGKLTITQNASGQLASASPFWPHPAYCLRATVAVAQASMNSGDLFAIEQRITREQAYLLFDQSSSLQLQLRASVIGVYSVSLSNSNNTERYTQTCNVTVANTWTQFTFPGIPAMPTGSGNWGSADTDWCYTIHVGIASGSSFQSATLGSWVADATVDSTSQLNMMATLSATLDVLFVQHEPGLICSPYLFIDETEQELLCSRYYAKSVDPAVLPATVSAIGGAVFTGLGATSAAGTVVFPVPMRIIPSSTAIWSPVSGASNQVYDLNAAATVGASVVASQVNSKGFSALGAGSGLVAGHLHFFHWSAEAEI